MFPKNHNWNCGSLQSVWCSVPEGRQRQGSQQKRHRKVEEMRVPTFEAYTASSLLCGNSLVASHLQTVIIKQHFIISKNSQQNIDISYIKIILAITFPAFLRGCAQHPENFVQLVRNITHPWKDGSAS